MVTALSDLFSVLIQWPVALRANSAEDFEVYAQFMAKGAEPKPF